MRKLAIALGVAVAMVLAGGLSWKAEATTFKSGTIDLPGLAKNYSPIDQAACRGWGPMCPPGWTWICTRYKCKCRRCW